jgi:hypothetical protein
LGFQKKCAWKSVTNRLGSVRRTRRERFASEVRWNPGRGIGLLGNPTHPNERDLAASLMSGLFSKRSGENRHQQAFLLGETLTG